MLQDATHALALSPSIRCRRHNRDPRLPPGLLPCPSDSALFEPYCRLGLERRVFRHGRTGTPPTARQMWLHGRPAITPGGSSARGLHITPRPRWPQSRAATLRGRPRKAPSWVALKASNQRGSSGQQPRWPLPWLRKHKVPTSNRSIGHQRK